MSSAGILAAPPARDNAGCADCSGHGLLAYAAGGSVVVVDTRSMQLVTVLPMPPPAGRASSSLLLPPSVTALQWLPEGVSMDELPLAPALQLAAGDRQGRIAIWDLNAASPPTWLGFGDADAKGRPANVGIQQLCWLHSSAWLLAAVHGPSLIVVWDPSSRASLWRYDTSVHGDTITCLRRNPLEPNQLCALGTRGLLVSLLAFGSTSDADFHVKLHQVSLSDERDKSSSFSSAGTAAAVAAKDGAQTGATVSSSGAPPPPLGSLARCLFSSQARGILYIMFPREILVFDLEFGMTLSSCGLPRGCGAFLDLVTDVSGDYLFCAHVDGKLSFWRRKEHTQVFVIMHVDTLLPSIGTTVPSPAVLAVTFCPLDFWIPPQSRSSAEDAAGGGYQPRRTSLVSIADDGRLWYWSLNHLSHPETAVPDFQLELAGQLHLLPSSVTTLAVSVPSLPATGSAAAPVQMVAVGTQAGSLELIDPAAFAATSSFSVHGNNAVRGVRWLGNSRLVSFSYTEVKGKGGGFANKLAVTCVRSGQTRAFRVHQKPERAPIRALRTSPSGRYMLILFREAPAEVWAMTRNPQMLRSLALPFTVMEWALPAAPKAEGSGHRPSLAYRERPTIASTVAAANASATSQPASHDEIGESFAFALVNGSLGVFELRGRRVRDFKPKWPASSFVSTDVLVTAMAYRMPHVVMGDRLGKLRWWDVVTGSSSWFNTYRGGIRRIKFAPVLPSDAVRGRVAILFDDNTIAIYDLDAQDPLSTSNLHPQLAGMLVLELDWYPVRSCKADPLLLCVLGADGSFCMLEVQAVSRTKSAAPSLWDRQRPMPVFSPALLPSPQALALRMLLQLGVKTSWFNADVECSGDLRHYLLETNLPSIGDPVVLELLLKALEPSRRAGRLLDAQSIRAYGAVNGSGCATRLAFAATHFGNHAEASFWLHLPRALMLLLNGDSVLTNQPADVEACQATAAAESSAPSNVEVRTTGPEETEAFSWKATGAGDRAAVCEASRERIAWHKSLGRDEAIQKLVHEHVAVGDFEAAVTLLLATPPDNPHFFVDALRAVSLAAAVSPGLHELAVKVVAANMVATDDSLAGTHLLCAVGRHQEACSQLQDAGRWQDASTLAASKLKGADLAKVLLRWAEHVVQNENNVWKAVPLFVAAGALAEALLALNAHHPDMAAMFLLACHEAKSSREAQGEQLELELPASLAERMQDVRAVCEVYGQHQRWLAQRCSDMSFY